MFTTIKMVRAVVALGMLASVTSGAQAAVGYVTGYGNITEPPGVYYGAGNFNGNFTTSRTPFASGTLELALRAKVFNGASIDGSSGVYRVSPGTPFVNGSGAPRGAWNYDFSINTGSVLTPLSNYTFLLNIDTDPTSGVNYQFSQDPITIFGDDKFYGANGVQNTSAGASGAQNSENSIFFPNLTAPGIYNFQLKAFLGGALVGEVDTVISSAPTRAVPEPETLALLGLGLAGLLAARRRKA